VGEFKIVSTGSGSISGSSAGGNFTETIGKFTQTGGTFQLCNGSAATLNVTGDFSISGGTLNLTTTASNGLINLSGDFSHTGSSILTKTGAGTGTFTFEKVGTHFIHLEEVIQVLIIQLILS
jgi:hypothetical protein